MTNSRKYTRFTPPSATPSRLDRKRTETREKIFRAATQLFTTKGFADTTVEDITEAADVGKGTFFNYFPSKEHVLGVMHEIQVGKIRAATEASRAARRRVKDVLRELMLSLAEEPGRSQPLARGLMSIVFANEALRTNINCGLAEGRGLVEEILRAGQDRGEVRKGISAKVMARQFQQCAFGTTLLWSLGMAGKLPELTAETFDAYWAGVKAE